MWKFKVDVVHEFVSSLQSDVGRGFLHVSNVFLCSFDYTIKGQWKLEMFRPLNLLLSLCTGIIAPLIQVITAYLFGVEQFP